jgi:hypothetical protein
VSRLKVRLVPRAIEVCVQDQSGADSASADSAGSQPMP